MPPRASDYSSGEYRPTPSSLLPAFVKGVPQGYTCIVCGHLVKDLDPFWEDICVMCLKNWARKTMPRLVPTAEAIEQHCPLSPTVKVVKARHEETTRIMPLSEPRHKTKIK